MNVTIINGSPRKNGATFSVLNYFKESLETMNSGVAVEFINLIDCNIKYCIGCQYCYKTGKCIIVDDRVEEIHDIIKNSNGIIFGTPTYGSNVTGLFKNFHDRVHMTMEQLLYRKPCINITTYENLMGSKAMKIMQEMVANAGGYNVNSMIIKNAFNKDPLNEVTKGKIENMAKKFFQKMHKNKPPLFSRIYTKIAVNIFMKPFVYKDKAGKNGIINSWVEKEIIKCK